MAALESARGIMKSVGCIPWSFRKIVWYCIVRWRLYKRPSDTYYRNRCRADGCKTEHGDRSKSGRRSVLQGSLYCTDNMEGFKQDVETIHLMGFDEINYQPVRLRQQIYTPTQKDIIFAEKVVKEITSRKQRIGIYGRRCMMIDIAFYDGAKRTIGACKSIRRIQGDL